MKKTMKEKIPRKAKNQVWNYDYLKNIDIGELQKDSAIEMILNIQNEIMKYIKHFLA